MQNGFPEDELKPLSCGPLTRDRFNEGHFELNDVLGNYSLTLVDSLSTLAILASTTSPLRSKRKPLDDFQNGVALYVRLYGDGTTGQSGTGERSRGFDLDSKVQVFETVIRGVGGLLSAHLFATGELPISQQGKTIFGGRTDSWANGFVYDGQLLRLAHDLATRLLPAFHTATGLPYPRVNLRRGIPFYNNAPGNQDGESGECPVEEPTDTEITETCSAGAGSLVLEFSLLSRLTGDMRFEQLAKRAFEAVWQRRSQVGLIGAGIDAESGHWVSPYTGIGAGIDSFFEYAFKSHILFSAARPSAPSNHTAAEEYFLSVWQASHAFNKHHLFRGSAFQHPHYVQGDLYTGAIRAYWIDSLSAYYPGLLALAGELEEAIETHLLYAALWTRYSGLPERWNAASGLIEGGLRWWGGRPEFIESTWYLYRATKDPWYLHVAETALRDIRARCYTDCGWAGLEDVRDGEQKDRMESFFLGETAKYLFLLFEPDHPLNRLDAPWVFTTEGHPVVIPKSARQPSTPVNSADHVAAEPGLCPVPKRAPPFAVSAVAARDDFFHAASLARLHMTPTLGFRPNKEVESAHLDISYDPSQGKNSSDLLYYPWTFPSEQMPPGFSSKMDMRSTFDLSFPTLPNAVSGALTLKRHPDGVFVNSVSGLKLSMIKEASPFYLDEPMEPDGPDEPEQFRIHTVSHLGLGRDERVLIAADAIADLNPTDPYFTRHRELAGVDLVFDVAPGVAPPPAPTVNVNANAGVVDRLLEHLASVLNQPLPLDEMLASAQSLRASTSAPSRPVLYGAAATGLGAGALPAPGDASLHGEAPLAWTSVYFVEGNACNVEIPANVPRQYQVLVMRRGGCTFSEKLQNIPSFAPSSSSLQLVIVVSSTSTRQENVRPALDEPQLTPRGVQRLHTLPLVMVEGGDATMELLKNSRSVGMRRRYYFSSQGLRISNLVVV